MTYHSRGKHHQGTRDRTMTYHSRGKHHHGTQDRTMTYHSRGKHHQGTQDRTMTYNSRVKHHQGTRDRTITYHSRGKHNQGTRDRTMTYHSHGKHHQGTQRPHHHLITLTELKHKITNRLVRLSEFVYKFNDKYISKNPNTTTSLCYPEGFQWSQEPKIYIILPGALMNDQNYGFWIMYLIDSLSHIYTSTPERNFHLVIVDFNTTDINIEDYLKKSALNKRNRRKFTYVKKTGFLCETQFNPKRTSQHVIKGMAGFFPKLARLSCGASDLYPEGSWEWMGYGLFACYKEDWDRFGGEDVEKFKYTWGGEDWDLLDRGLGLTGQVRDEVDWDRFGGEDVEKFKYTFGRRGLGLTGQVRDEVDWDWFGGEDVEKFKYTWGGKDWDLLDRVCSVQLEAERMCMPGLYHFPHEKKGDFYKKKKKPQ
ncbi:predicted protein [Nematostella vectensis]|uniref:Galactosyltransferase C-terminal domain-containing protein n=1 Tax=Nematostella vectensis TaxID=45351 RepID=A7S5X7_NEMVE|nr:predicted protein [Nematostella vectensis]|eukprot:XP_001632945.1 predicted protein [Nematostella vectensis]